MVIVQTQNIILNWDRIVWSLDEIRHRKGWHNLVYDIPSLKQILEGDQYELYCREDLLHPRSYTDIAHLKEIASQLMR